MDSLGNGFCFINASIRMGYKSCAQAYILRYNLPFACHPEVFQGRASVKRIVGLLVVFLLTGCGGGGGGAVMEVVEVLRLPPIRSPLTGHQTTKAASTARAVAIRF